MEAEARGRPVARPARSLSPMRHRRACGRWCRRRGRRLRRATQSTTRTPGSSPLAPACRRPCRSAYAAAPPHANHDSEPRHGALAKCSRCGRRAPSKRHPPEQSSGGASESSAAQRRDGASRAGVYPHALANGTGANVLFRRATSDVVPRPDCRMGVVVHDRALRAGRAVLVPHARRSRLSCGSRSGRLGAIGCATRALVCVASPGRA